MRLITTTHWRDEGRTRAELNKALGRGEVVRLRRGVVADAGEASRPDLHLLRMRAAAPFLGASTCFGHESAALLHGLPVMIHRLDRVVVIRSGGGHGGVNPILHARRASLRPDEQTVIDGLRVTTLGRTVSDLVRRLPFPEAVMVADAALAARAQLSDLLDLSATGRGCRMARLALGFADARAESPGESLSRVRIMRAGLPMPEIQHNLVDATGRFIARVDFWWEKYGLAGEFDGMAKYSSLMKPGQTPQDVIRMEKQREQLILEAGYRIVRWLWSDLWDGTLERRLTRAITNSSPSQGLPERSWPAPEVWPWT